MIALLASAAIFAPLGGHPLLGDANLVCKPIGALQTSAPATPTLLYRQGDPGRVKRLDTLPKANHEKAVLRTVGGCAAPMVVGYQVQGDGPLRRAERRTREMIALVLAAAVAGQATAAERTPNFFHQPANCPAVVEREVRRQLTAVGERARSGLQYAVWRRLEGCSVPTPVGYHPGRADPALKREDAPGDRR